MKNEIEINGEIFIKKSEANEQEVVCNISDDASIATNYIGKFVIVRSRNEGINAGTVIAADKTGVQLKECRRLWYHKPANNSLSWYEGVAISGLSDDSKVSATVKGKMIIEDYSMTIATQESQKSIMEKVPHA